MKKQIITLFLFAVLTIPLTTAAQNITLSQLVELLAALDLITSDKVAEARRVVGNLDNKNKLITVMNPNGGDILYTGKTYKLIWATSGFAADEEFNIFYMRDGYTLKTPLTKTKGGVFEWAVPVTMPLGKYKIGVVAASNVLNSDWSDSWFTVEAPVSGQRSLISIVTPNGYEKYNAGDTVLVRWTAPTTKENELFYVGYAKLFGTSDTFIGVTKGTLYSWTIPSTLEAGRYKIFVRFDDAKNISDYSDNWFTIDAPGTTTASVTQSTPSSPSSIVRQVLLSSVRVTDDKVIARYTNKSGSKALLFAEHTGKIGDVAFSAQGNDVEDSFLRAGISVRIGDKVKLCLEDDIAVCSAVVTVSGSISSLFKRSLLGRIFEALRPQ